MPLKEKTTSIQEKWKPQQDLSLEDTIDATRKNYINTNLRFQTHKL